MNATGAVFPRDEGRRKKPRNGAEYALQIRIACWLHSALPAESGAWWGAWDGGFTSSRAAFFRRLRGVKAGTPDLCFIRKGRVYWVELKASEKTRPSKAQKRVFAALEAAGCQWAVCRSGKEVESVLRRWRFTLACHFHGGYELPGELLRQPRRRLTDLGVKRNVNRSRAMLGLPPLEGRA